MDRDQFSNVDQYIDDLFVSHDQALENAERQMAEAGLPEIHISRGQGKFLSLLCKMIGAQRILEIGTLGGYSTIWLARSVPDTGYILTLESDPFNAAVAQKNLDMAELTNKVEIQVGEALNLLPDIEAEAIPFDVVFLDADKINYVAYLDAAVCLTRPGGLIVADNVVRSGSVLNPDPSDPSAMGAAQFNQALAKQPNLESIILQQVGIKGHDGLAIARVKN